MIPSPLEGEGKGEGEQRNNAKKNKEPSTHDHRAAIKFYYKVMP